MTLAAISLLREPIADFCRRWNIQELALLGSVLSERFRPDSDAGVTNMSTTASTITTIVGAPV